ncbi:MAG: serine/threonine-protein kinase [Planctomycetota bacterium]
MAVGERSKMEMDSSGIWDRWCAAREERPDLAPEEFAAWFGAQAGEVIALLATLRGLGARSELPPLVDVLPALDGSPGRPFAGFVIEHGLGAGSTGLVFAARRANDGARVALKILNPVLAVSPDRRDAVLREAEVAGRMEHPGIARLVASGVEQGYAWIATEWVDGDTLLALSAMDEGELAASVESMRAARVELNPDWPREPASSVRAWPLAAKAALEVGLQLAAAITHAHERGIVHRDLKPQNVLLARDGRVKVIDFGLASVEGTRLAVSSSGEWAGTPLYMAPEQFFGTGPAGPLTDVHALGLILADVATGAISSPERQAIESLDTLGRSARAALKDALRRMPRGLRDVVVRCTEHEPRHRHGSVREVLEDLTQLLRGAPLVHGAATPWVRVARALARHPLRSLAMTAGALALGVLAAWGWRSARTGSVHIATGFQGEPIWIDGVSYGLAPQEAALRSGRHVLEFREWDNTLMCPPFGIDVPLGGRISELFVFRPTANVHRVLPPPSSDYSTSAWLQIGTPAPRIQVWIDGTERGELPGITALLLPLGDHHLRIEAPGCKPFEREVKMRDGRLCFVSAELDPLDSPWTTIVLYCPFDDLVRRGLREKHGLREYCETLPMAWYVPGNSVNKAYWGPSENGEGGEATLALDLPFALGAVEVEIGEPDITLSVVGGRAWSVLEMGPSVEELRPVYRISQSLPEAPQLTWDQASLSSMPARCGDRRELLLRFRVSPATVGIDNASTAALRTNAMPQWPPGGELVWQPALRVRIKP